MLTVIKWTILSLLHIGVNPGNLVTLRIISLQWTGNIFSLVTSQFRLGIIRWTHQDFLGGSVVKESAWQCWRCRRHKFSPWIRKSLWRRKWQPTPVFLPGEYYGQRSLVGYSSWGYKESERTEQLSMHTCKMNSSSIIQLPSSQTITFMANCLRDIYTKMPCLSEADGVWEALILPVVQIAATERDSV